MDLSAIIVTSVLGGSFLAFIIWMALHSRRTEANELPPNNPQARLSDK